METIIIIFLVLLLLTVFFIWIIKRKKIEPKNSNYTDQDKKIIDSLINYKTVQLNDIPSEILEVISLNSIDTLLAEIKDKRKSNELKDAFLKTLIRKDLDLYKQIGNYFLWSFFDVYTIASNEEKNGNILLAAKVYWYNILKNGTVASDNFDRLLICLGKLNFTEKELVVAILHSRLNFVDPSNVNEKLKNRIKRLEEKLSRS